MKTAAIILNTPEEIAEITETDVICADAGYRRLSGKRPLAVVGDLDSLKDAPTDVPVVTYPVEKNMTDGQLAVDYAKTSGYGAVKIYGALGGRIDHILGNIGLLAYCAENGMDAEICERDCNIRLYSSSFTVAAEIGARISVVPFGGDVLVAHSHGLYYPLENLLLTSGTNRGISNIAEKKEIGLDFVKGRLLVIQYRK